MMVNSSAGKQNWDGNPGVQGHGIPSLYQSSLGQVRPILRNVRDRQFSTALNHIRASNANLWNFYLAAKNKSAVLCSTCGRQGAAFVASSNWRDVSFQAKCPHCDSRSRHRGLAVLLPTVIARKPLGDILFFAPEQIILKLLPSWTQDRIVTTDYADFAVDFPNEDIQNLSFADHSYAMILCNHVLEHVPDDDRALAECARVLVAGGIAVFTIPGDYPKRETVPFAHPDDNGHHRHYGMDVIDKMQRHFKQVEAVDMHQGTDPRLQIRPHDYAFICTA